MLLSNRIPAKLNSRAPSLVDRIGRCTLNETIYPLYVLKWVR